MSLNSIEVTHSPCWREFVMVSGISILNFSTLMNGFSLLRSSIDLHRLLGFGTKNSRLKRMICLILANYCTAFFHKLI